MSQDEKLTEKHRLEQANHQSHSIWDPREPDAPEIVWSGGLGVCKQCGNLEMGLTDESCPYPKLPDWSPEIEPLPGHIKQKVYVASKLRHAPMICEDILRRPDIQFTCGWVYLCQHVPDDGDNRMADNFWAANMRDVAAADFVIVYGVGDDKLRGALIEAGVGLALGKTVIVVGEHSDYGTWQHIDGVVKARTLQHAYAHIVNVEVSRLLRLHKK